MEWHKVDEEREQSGGRQLVGGRVKALAAQFAAKTGQQQPPLRDCSTRPARQRSGGAVKIDTIQPSVAKNCAISKSIYQEKSGIAGPKRSRSTGDLLKLDEVFAPTMDEGNFASCSANLPAREKPKPPPKPTHLLNRQHSTPLRVAEEYHCLETAEGEEEQNIYCTLDTPPESPSEKLPPQLPSSNPPSVPPKKLTTTPRRMRGRASLQLPPPPSPPGARAAYEHSFPSELQRIVEEMNRSFGLSDEQDSIRDQEKNVREFEWEMESTPTTSSSNSTQQNSGKSSAHLKGAYDIDEEPLGAKVSPRTSELETKSGGILKNFRRFSQPSVIDVEKFLRIKQNLTKKMGKVRSKVRKSSLFGENSVSVIGLPSISDLETDHQSTEEHHFSSDDELFVDDWSEDENLDGNGNENSSASPELPLNVSILPDVVPQKSTTTSAICTAERRNSRSPSPEQEQKQESGPSGKKDSPSSNGSTPPSLVNWALKMWEANSDSTLRDGENEEFEEQKFITEDQPLYQHYLEEEDRRRGSAMGVRRTDSTSTTATRRSSQLATATCSSLSSASSISAVRRRCSSRRDRFVAASEFGSQRSLWCEMEEVRAAGVLSQLSEGEKKRQEAMFEVVTSEASYLSSLNLLITHFMAAPEFLPSKISDNAVIDRQERKLLFSNIMAIRDCSEGLMAALESRLESLNCVLDEVCDLLIERLETDFDAYVKYCANQIYQDRCLKKLREERSSFREALHRLESAKECQGLDLRSFLMLPMQRVTRYPLLIFAILERTDHSANTDRYRAVQKALALANQLVNDCNEGARRMERMEQLIDLQFKLVYKNNDPIRRLALARSNRHLVKSGQLVQLAADNCGEMAAVNNGNFFTIGRKRSLAHLAKNMMASNGNNNCGKYKKLELLLFTDLVMVAKKRSNGDVLVRNYSSRQFVDSCPLEASSAQVPVVALANYVRGGCSSNSGPSNKRIAAHLFSVTMMNDARGKQTEYILAAASETERERWLNAIRPPTSSNPDEKIYAEWDCPQAMVVSPYTAQQQDEINLYAGDIVDVRRKMPDGWFQGDVRSCGGIATQSGWFPSCHVKEIVNDHVRAKNYKKRLQMIQAAQKELKMAQNSQRASSETRLRRLSNAKTFFL